MTPLLLTLALSLLLVGASVYAARLLGRTLSNIRRTRRALLVWNRPSAWRQLIVPGLLTIASTLALAAALIGGGGAQSLFFASGFALTGLVWIAGVRLSSLVIITPDGILTDINRPSDLLRWSAVEDYFEGSPTPWHYGFFYYDARGQRRRMNLLVPRRLRPPFEELIRVALCDRIERSLPEAVRRSAPLW